MPPQRVAMVLKRAQPRPHARITRRVRPNKEPPRFIVDNLPTPAAAAGMACCGTRRNELSGHDLDFRVADPISSDGADILVGHELSQQE